jgi:hypothetical protein
MEILPFIFFVWCMMHWRDILGFFGIILVLGLAAWAVYWLVYLALWLFAILIVVFVCAVVSCIIYEVIAAICRKLRSTGRK